MLTKKTPRKPGRPREPVSDKLYDALRREIVEHTLDNGGKFPSELELCDRFAVSRGTLRRVLKRIEADGLLIRRPGDGSYVTQEGVRGIEEMRETASGGTKLNMTGGEKKTLTLASFEYPETNRDFWENVFKGFGAAHPRIALEPLASDENRAADWYDGATMPDVFNVNASDIRTLVARNMVLDISPLEKELELSPAFRDGVLEQCRVDGRLYGVPQEISLPTMYCNGALLEQCGLHIDDDTWDWHNFLKIMTAALDHLDARVAGMNFLAVNTYMLYFGVFRCDKPYVAKAYRQTKRAATLLEWFNKAASVERVLSSGAGDHQKELRKFLAGEMLFYFHGTTLNPYLKRFCHFPVVKLRPPREPGATGQKIVVTWAVKANTTLPLASFDWLTFVSNSQTQKRMALNGGNISARKTETNNCPFGKKKLANELVSSVYNRLPSRWHQVLEHEVWQPAFEELLSGRKSPASTLDMIDHAHRKIDTLHG